MLLEQSARQFAESNNQQAAEEYFQQARTTRELSRQAHAFIAAIPTVIQ